MDFGLNISFEQFVNSVVISIIVERARKEASERINDSLSFHCPDCNATLIELQNIPNMWIETISKGFTLGKNEWDEFKKDFDKDWVRESNIEVIDNSENIWQCGDCGTIYESVDSHSGFRKVQSTMEEYNIEENH